MGQEMDPTQTLNNNALTLAFSSLQIGRNTLLLYTMYPIHCHTVLSILLQKPEMTENFSISYIPRPGPPNGLIPVTS